MSAVEIAVKSLVTEIKQAAISRADRGLNVLRNSAMTVLSHDGTGRRYGKHIASAPGQPPAPDKGNLRRNWSQKKNITGDLRIEMIIKSKMFYYRFLNEGTSKMAPRPIKKPVLKAARPKIVEIFSSL